MSEQKLISDDNDIIIKLTDHLKSFDEKEFTIIFADLDKELEFTEGSTERNLEDASKDGNFTIIRKSSSQAKMRRPTSLKDHFGIA